jgi:hypothetical protein
MNIIKPMDIMIFQTKRSNKGLAAFMLEKVFSFRYNENCMLEYKKLPIPFKEVINSKQMKNYYGIKHRKETQCL